MRSSNQLPGEETWGQLKQKAARHIGCEGVCEKGEARKEGRKQRSIRARRAKNEEDGEATHAGEEGVPSGSSWTTRREDPSITRVPHLLPVARTCRTSSPLQRRRRGSQVPSSALIVLGSLAPRKKCVIIRGHCACGGREENSMRMFSVTYALSAGESGIVRLLTNGLCFRMLSPRCGGRLCPGLKYREYIRRKS
ncbi:hypothetical protein DMN91_006696 [Ooceraea biroi]|uniref:Uncharacterized protein n=1 Tax=Ooceraea biroi TaxID=2015173 RepID=A0A3L8DI23_OOCBI|nr:hypothetical protein DMN91_006696 [Ooceraea biroi]